MSLFQKLRPTSPGSRRRWRLLSVFAISVLVLGGLCFVFRAPLLIGLANAWVVNDPLVRGDAIVVLGGGLESRPFAAAKLYGEGYAPLVLCMDVRRSAAEELAGATTETEMTRRILLSNGVPESAVAVIGDRVTSTYDESCAVLEWTKKAGAKSIIIATDLFHTRRARWLFRKQLRGTGVEICIVAVAPQEYRTTNWWTREEGLVAFQNEWVKLPYYWLKY